MWMLWAGMAAAAAGILAFLAVKEPWAHLTITQAATALEDAVVVDVTLRGHAAFIGSVATVLAVVLAASGIPWFFYGLQRGWSMPSILNPALLILVTLAGLVIALLSSQVWFVWQDAMIARAEAVGLTTREMTQLLEQQPIPIVVIERLPGLISFGGMMALPVPSTRTAVDARSYPHRNGRACFVSHLPHVNIRHCLLTVCTREQFGHAKKRTSAAQV